jgi:hypothetical protein
MKGQYFSFDAVIGATIFILTMMALLSYWYGVSNSFEQTQNALAREAFRISEMMFTPTDRGLAMGWKDLHYDYSKIEAFCDKDETPREFFPSAYNLTIVFYNSTMGVTDEPICVWGDDAYKSMNAENTYRFRRVFSIQSEDGITQLGYADLFFYQLSE